MHGSLAHCAEPYARQQLEVCSSILCLTISSSAVLGCRMHLQTQGVLRECVCYEKLSNGKARWPEVKLHWHGLHAAGLHAFSGPALSRGAARRFHYSMMAWLPTYFTDTLSLTLSQAAQVSLLPPVASIAVSAVAGDPRAVCQQAPRLCTQAWHERHYRWVLGAGSACLMLPPEMVL